MISALLLAHPISAAAGATGLQCGATVAGKVALKADLVCQSGHGIVLGANTVLDCAGHRVIGGNKMGQYGIYVRDASYAVVKNCVVERFEVGIRLRGAMQARLVKNTARNNLRYGVELTQGSSGALVRGNTIADNGDEGIHVSGPEDGDGDHQIVDNTFAGNANEGIYLLRSNGNLVDGNTIRDQGTAGIYVKDSARNTISGNTLVNDPLQLVYGAEKNVLSDNTIVGQAVKFNQASNNQVRRMVVRADRGRPSIAYDFTNSSRNVVVDSEVASPEDYGIRVKSGSVDNVFTRLSVEPALRCSVDSTSSVRVTDQLGAPLTCR